MKRLLGEVKVITDPDQHKKVRVNLIGLTDGLPEDNLPWSFPLDEQSIVPAIGDKVWVYVEQMPNEEDFDYSKTYYQRFTEITYKEAYAINESASYQIKNSQRITGGQVQEPAPISSVEYPKNRVIKYSNITMEFDEGNQRFEITDESGNYMRFSPDGIVFKSASNRVDVTTGSRGERLTGDYSLQDGNGNTITTNPGGITLSKGGLPEPMVLGTSLLTYINSQITTIFNSHFHLYLTPLIPLPSPTPTAPPLIPMTPGNYLSPNHKTD